MLRELWCLTPHWKWLFTGMILLHGGYHILFFDDYLNLWALGLRETEFFNSSWYYYTITFIPLLELVAGLFLILGYKERLMLGVIFHALLFSGYYALDSNYLLGFMIYFGLSFFGLFVLSGQYYDCSQEKCKKYTKIPTGGL